MSPRATTAAPPPEPLDAEALAAHRPALLRHCYRMLGCLAEAEDLVQVTLERAWRARASRAAGGGLRRWLYAIATNACLDALAQRRRRRSLPQLEAGPATGAFELQEEEPARWVTPAPDALLFPGPAEAAEARETVGLAFVALAQALPPRQRAVVLLKDVLGFSAADIAGALALSVPAVSSALHRGRQALAGAPALPAEPTPAALAALVRAWETRDVDGLVALLRRDVELAMPPHPVWLRGTRAVARFLVLPRFAAYWTSVRAVTTTRANGQPALLFHRAGDDGVVRPHSVMLARFRGTRAAALTVFVGPAFLRGFEG